MELTAVSLSVFESRPARFALRIYGRGRASGQIGVIKRMWPFSKKTQPDDPGKKRLEDFGPAAFVSCLCIGPKRLPVMHGVRMKTTNSQNSGWILESRRELHHSAADPQNYKRFPLALI